MIHRCSRRSTVAIMASLALLMSPIVAVLEGCQGERQQQAPSSAAPPPSGASRPSPAPVPASSALTKEQKEQPEEREYRPGTVSENCSGLIVTKVTVAASGTQLRLSYSGCRGQLGFQVFPPGHSSAYFIRDADSTKRYELLNFDGVSLPPKFTFAKPGKPFEFTLTFEPIAPNTRAIHLVEGSAANGAHVMNIPLK